jgi:hypothetical protein
LVNLENETNSVRQCTESANEGQKVYELLKYKYVPFAKIKSVVHAIEIFKKADLNIRFLITHGCNAGE